MLPPPPQTDSRTITSAPTASPAALDVHERLAKLRLTLFLRAAPARQISHRLAVSGTVVRSSSLNLSLRSEPEQSVALFESLPAFSAPSSLYNIIHHHRQQVCPLFRPSCATSHAMARLHITALLSPDQEEQLSALRTLKNEIVGHDQKKEKWVENGIIEPVVKILESSRSSQSTNGKDKSRGRAPPSRALTGEESVRLQALQILASLANGMAVPWSHARGHSVWSQLTALRRWLCFPRSHTRSWRLVRHIIEHSPRR